MGHHYAEMTFMKTIFLLFSHMKFMHEKISHAFNLPWEILQLFKNVHQKFNILAKKKHGKTFTNFSLQKFELNLFLAYFKGRLARFLYFLTETFFFNFIMHKEVKKTVANFFLKKKTQIFEKSSPKKYVFFFCFFTFYHPIWCY